MYLLKSKLFCVFFLLLSTSFFSQTNQAPSLMATGRQIFCSGEEINIVEDFSISDPDDVGIAYFSIQISEGYQVNFDTLTLTGTHPTIVSTWSASEGKLTFEGVGGVEILYTDLVKAVKEVVFNTTTANVTAEKHFSLNIGDANYLPSTGHFYEYVSDVGITWTAARTAAAGRTYFGLQGYLATLATVEEAKLAGEQASGAGWIGGSDADQEGVWKWVTGPEAGTIFWNGEANGSSPNYANWNVSEPNNWNGDEDYAHVTAPSIGTLGSWNDLPDTGDPSGPYQPKGYVIEYGGTSGDPVLNISASTSIYLAKIITTSGATVCQSDSAEISATADEGSVLWYDTQTGGSLLFTGNNFTTPSLESSKTYYAATCATGTRVPVQVNILPSPRITSTEDSLICDTSATISAVASAGDIYWFETPTSTTPIHIGTSYNATGITTDTTYYVEARTVTCTSKTRTAVKILITTPPTIVSTQGYTTCLTSATISAAASAGDVYWYDSPTSNTPLFVGDTYNPTGITESTTFYAEVRSGNCISTTRAPVEVVIDTTTPTFDLVHESYILCQNIGEIILETTNATDGYSYVWKKDGEELSVYTPSIKAVSAGIYTVKAVSSTGCESEEKKITVEASEIATITKDDVVIIDNSDNNSIEIINELGVGDYEFSLDNEFGVYRKLTFFDHLSTGTHRLYIRDKNGCGSVTYQFLILSFPKYFTPNGDIKNDIWEIEGFNSDLLTIVEVSVFNRYGTLLYQFDKTKIGWDGTYDGKSLPSDTYWYRIVLSDINGRYIEKTGSVSLIRK